MIRNTGFLIILLLLSINLLAQTNPTAFVGAKIYTASGKTFDSGVLVIQNGEILFVGSEKEIRLTSEHKIVDVSGKVILPGLVDTHSHIGMDWGFDNDSPTQPGLRILDAINPFHDTFNRARAGGITTVNIMPGSGHLMSGQTIYVKPKKVNDVKDMIVETDLGIGVFGGMKMANGTNSIRNKPFPGTRGKSAAIVRKLYYEALDYKNKIEMAGNDISKLPPKNINLDPLVEILEKKRVVHHHTHRADDIMTVLRLKEEFGFDVVLHHVSEGWKVAEEIAEAKVPCSIIVVDSPGGKLEAVGLKFETAKILFDAGVDVAIHTDDWITDSRMFLRMAAMTVRAGLSPEKAIASLTINGAKMLQVDKQVGSLEAGKNADFIILNGEPFSVYTHLQETWIEGEKVFDRENKDDYKFAVGGFNVYRSSGHTHHVEDGGLD